MPEDKHVGRWLKAETVEEHQVWVTKREARWFVAVREGSAGATEAGGYPRPHEILPLRYESWTSALDGARAEIERRQARRRAAGGAAEPAGSEASPRLS